MTKAQLKHFERRLLEEREQIRHNLSGLENETRTPLQAEAGDLSKVPFHLADPATDSMQRELDASNATRETRLLFEIDEALRRLYRTPELYGRCEETGKQIPLERLELVPWARTCGPNGGGRPAAESGTSARRR